MDIIRFENLRIGQVFTEALLDAKGMWHEGNFKGIKIGNEKACLVHDPFKKGFVHKHHYVVIKS